MVFWIKLDGYNDSKMFPIFEKTDKKSKAEAVLHPMGPTKKIPLVL